MAKQCSGQAEHQTSCNVKTHNVPLEHDTLPQYPFEVLTWFENSEKDDKCRTICQIRKQTTIEAIIFMRIIYETDILKQH
jgi:hypothetical protein